jgi:hypothetical protein
MYVFTKRGWYGFDLDGTIAYDETGRTYDPEVIGPPIPKAIARLKALIEEGYEVRIVTARADNKRSVAAIERWCAEHIGHVLTVTNQKDYAMIALYDDRAIQMVRNTGEIVRTDEKIIRRCARLEDLLYRAVGIMESFLADATGWRDIRDAVQRWRDSAKDLL